MHPTIESLPPLLVLPKMPEMPATAVHPPKRSSKDGPSMTLQQQTHSEGTAGRQKLTGCSTFFHCDSGWTGVLSCCSQVFQELQNQRFEAVPAAVGLPSL